MKEVMLVRPVWGLHLYAPQAEVDVALLLPLRVGTVGGLWIVRVAP